MKIILTEQCESFTGSLGREFGYHIQRRKNGFFAKRNTKGIVPQDGHWRFIVACAEQARMKLHIADINIRAYELWQALIEAGQYFIATELEHKYEVASPSQTLNAKQVLDFAEEHDIINLKTTFGL